MKIKIRLVLCKGGSIKIFLHISQWAFWVKWSSWFRNNYQFFVLIFLYWTPHISHSFSHIKFTFLTNIKKKISTFFLLISNPKANFTKNPLLSVPFHPTYGKKDFSFALLFSVNLRILSINQKLKGFKRSFWFNMILECPQIAYCVTRG